MILREMLSRSHLTADALITEAELSRRVADVLQDYRSDTSINAAFASDVLSILVAALELAETVKAPHYILDEVLTTSGVLTTKLAQVQTHATIHRPRIMAFGLSLKATGKLMPNLFSTKAEALAHVKLLEDAGMTPGSFDVHEIEVGSARIHRPSTAIPSPGQSPQITSDGASA
jgi:hypothetical protein